MPVKDSFTYSVADRSLRGHLVKEVHVDDSYFEEKITPDEFVVLLSCKSSHYPVSFEKFCEAPVQEITASEVFPASGEYSDLFDSAVYSGSRVSCDICEIETNRVYEINYENGKSIVSQLNSTNSNVIFNPEDKSSYEMDSFYHCHYCMKDIHEEIQRYMERSGRAVVLGNTI